MAAHADYEWELLPELEGDFEDEGEPFLGDVGSWLRRQWTNVQTPGTPLRKSVLGAAHSIVRDGLPALGGAYGGITGGLLGSLTGAPPAIGVGAGAGAALGAGAGKILGSAIDPWIPEREWENDSVFEQNPLRRAQLDALMEHLGHAATEAESEAEAEAFIGALIPLASQLLPKAASAIMGAAPNLIKGLAGATRRLRRRRASRPLVRTLPSIVRQTAAGFGRQAATGQRITPQMAVQSLAQNAASLMTNPAQIMQAQQHSQSADARYHAANPAAGPPPTMNSAVPTDAMGRAMNAGSGGIGAAGACPCGCGDGGVPGAAQAF